MRVAVTGATGLLGANIVRALLAEGHAVRVGVRPTSKPVALEGLDVEKVNFDLGDREALLAAFRGCEAVVHAAASVWVGRTGREATFKTNVDGTDNVCAAVAEAGVRRLLYVSTVSALGVRDDGVPSDEDTAFNLDWIGCAYAESKRQAAIVVDGWVAKGVDAVIVNPTYMLGPYDARPGSGRMILEVARGKALLAPPGVNDFVDVRDVARGALLALHNGRTGRKYILGGEGMSYRDAWTRIAAQVASSAGSRGRSPRSTRSPPAGRRCPTTPSPQHVPGASSGTPRPISTGRSPMHGSGSACTVTGRCIGAQPRGRNKVQRPGPDDRRSKPKRRGEVPPTPAAEAAIKARADELHARGMPIQMATAVAHGRLDLNEALEKLARREEVNRLMEKHQLSRALATQIALKQASLEAVLAHRRMQLHRDTNRDRSVLDAHATSGVPITLLLHGHRRVTGKVMMVDAYMFRFQPEEGEAEDIHKLQVKAAFVPDDYKRVRKVLKYDKKLEQAPLGPVPRPQDRYTCSDKRLFRYMDEKVEVQATLLEGEQMHGVVSWFSRFEFGLHLKGEAEIIVFRHALHDLEEL
jgi:dihydroflavonol-4-reductase